MRKREVPGRPTAPTAIPNAKVCALSRITAGRVDDDSFTALRLRLRCGRGRAQTSDESPNHARRQLGPVRQQLVQNRLCDRQHPGALDSDDRSSPRFGHERGELADRAARAELDEDAPGTLNAHKPLDDRIQVVFHVALADDEVACLDDRLVRRRATAIEDTAGSGANRSTLCNAATRSTMPSSIVMTATGHHHARR